MIRHKCDQAWDKQHNGMRLNNFSNIYLSLLFKR